MCAAAPTSPGNEKTPGEPGVSGGARYWDRTSDLFRVREARYRCANRACSGMFTCEWRWRRDSNPCKRLCRPVPSRSATPPCGLTPRAVIVRWNDPCTRADDETRTRDPHLGKVMRYQLRYIRVFPGCPGHSYDFSRRIGRRKTGTRAGVSRSRFAAGPPHPVCSTLGPPGPIGRLAQLVARFLHTEEVISSSLVSPTTEPPLRRGFVV